MEVNLESVVLYFPNVMKPVPLVDKSKYGVQVNEICFEFAGSEKGHGCYSTDEPKKGNYTNTECFSMECDIMLGNSENDANADGCCCQMDTCLSGGKKSCCRASKVNDISAGGVLRYALHLRFLSPFSKKSSRSRQQCKSDLSSDSYSHITQTEEERRFYLYNDIRVVFPQRHSDTDEGKVCGN